MRDTAIAIVTLAAFCGFISMVSLYIKEADLLIISALVMACAIYDFWRTLYGAGAKKNGS